jgi:endonuclease/exonuclease/phosphatase family metal-dependent hydrolase
MVRLRVATLNILNLADRWPERQSLIYSDMAALQPDLLGLQEVVYVMHQDRLIGAAGDAPYTAVRAWAGRPEYGNSLLLKAPLEATEVERLELTFGRSALRAVVALPGDRRLLVAVTHLHHVVEAEAERDAQASELLAWLDGGPPADAQTVVGDFNAEPVEPAYGRMQASGFQSAMAEANGAEPSVTWPSGLQAPAMDTDGDPGCLDYIWVRGSVRVASARLAFDRPAVDDPTLYPSDHLGLLAELEIG